MSQVFAFCTSLSKIPNISNWDTSNVISISGIFLGCTNLSLLPDISIWNTKNTTNMSEIFSFCKSLILLPDISVWNVNKVTNMERMFFNCQKLSVLPNIEKWKTDFDLKVSDIFSGCSSLLVFPDISKWNIKSKENINIYDFKDSSNSNNIANIFSGSNKSISLSIENERKDNLFEDGVKKFNCFEKSDLINNNNDIKDDYYDNFYN